MRVATALKARLSRTERKRIEERLTDSPEAYTLYLRAGTTDLSPGLPTFLRHLYLDRAITQDPEFAHAYARKASAYSLALVDNVASGAADFTALVELDRLTRQNAGQALALDRLHQYRWRWVEAQQVYERALGLSPDDLDLLRLYSQFNSHRGNHAKAIRLAQRAVGLAPAEPGRYFRLGTVFLHAGGHDATIAAFEAFVSLALGDEEKTLDWLESAIGKIETLDSDASYHSLMFLAANAFADPVLDEPRFQAVRNRIKTRSGVR